MLCFALQECPVHGPFKAADSPKLVLMLCLSLSRGDNTAAGDVALPGSASAVVSESWPLKGSLLSSAKETRAPAQTCECLMKPGTELTCTQATNRPVQPRRMRTAMQPALLGWGMAYSFAGHDGVRGRSGPRATWRLTSLGVCSHDWVLGGCNRATRDWAAEEPAQQRGFLDRWPGARALDEELRPEGTTFAVLTVPSTTALR